MSYHNRPEEVQYWFCYCRECDWESDPAYERCDLCFEVCPNCESSNISDKKEWV